MSRVGKTPIQIPSAVKVTVKGQDVFVEGPKGKLSFKTLPYTSAKVEGSIITIDREGNNAEARMMHGTCRARIANMVEGVTAGYSKKLEIQGVGFKASVAGNVVTMNLGYAHPCVYPLPEGVKVTVDATGTKLAIDGIDKNDVGRVAAELRAYYPPEPYKGKGVRYEGEHVVRKEGKTVQ
jgi:large subunit ribosomal protein L6